MARYLVVVASVVSLLIDTDPASCQDLVYLKGMRVRVTELPAAEQQASPRRWIGEVAFVSADTLALLLPDGDVRLVPTHRVGGIDVSTGEHRATGRGALIGAGAGVIGGTVTALLVCRGDACNPSGGDLTGFAVGVLGLGGLVIGTALGVVVGGLIDYEGWQEAGIAVRPAVRMGGMGTSITLGVSLPLPQF